MSRQEFLNILQASLTGRVNISQIAENVNYYDDYITTQIRMGRSEEEVIAELGDPRLLAKSIIEANKYADEGADRREGYGREEERDYTLGYGGTAYRKSQKRTLPIWFIVTILIVVALLVISVVFSIFMFLAPVLIPVIFICLLLRMTGRRN